MIAILAVLVVVLSYRSGHRHDSVSVGNFSAVEARVDALSGQMQTLQKSVRAVTKRGPSALPSAAATKQSKRLSVCITQIQRENDDLQAFLAYRTPPRRDRVSGACRTLLKPRFAR